MGETEPPVGLEEVGRQGCWGAPAMSVKRSVGRAEGKIDLINNFTHVMIFSLTLNLSKLLGLRVDGLKGSII